MQEGISVREAAEKLGTTERAVRFRLQRKTLEGRRIDGKWWVYLNGTEVPHTVATRNDTVVPEWFRDVVQTSLDQAEEIGRLKERIGYLEAMLNESENVEQSIGLWAWIRGRLS